MPHLQHPDPVAIEGFYRFKKADSFNSDNRRERVWVEEIENRYRTIYLRCVGCYQIFKIGSGYGTRSDPLTITENGVIMPCIICPDCNAHMFTTLVDYEPGRVMDVFNR